MPHDEICKQIINSQTKAPITKKTLYDKFREELDAGLAKANALVAQSLFRKATGNGPQNVTAAIFWLKTKARWKESQQVEISGPDGGPVATTNMTKQEFEEIARGLLKEV